MYKIPPIVRVISSSLLGRKLEDIPRRYIEACDVLSFDVFDTLIFRRVICPEDVFGLIYPDDEGFKEARIGAERKARDELSNEEISIDEIYQNLRGYEPEKEIDKEKEVCYANPEALVFYEYVKRKGKKIIITSDTYLSSDDMSVILEKSGYNISNVELFISSDLGCTKRSGNLYRSVVKGLGTDNILHIGNNLFSDWWMAKKAGIKGALYRRGRGVQGGRLE